MIINRIVPNIRSDSSDQSRAFYVDFLGFEIGMRRDEIITFVAPHEAQIQISVVREDELNSPLPQISIEVSDAEEMHRRAVAQSIEIIYPLTVEPWRVRRFFVKDPNGAVINILSHLENQ